MNFLQDSLQRNGGSSLKFFSNRHMSVREDIGLTRRSERTLFLCRGNHNMSDLSSRARDEMGDCFNVQRLRSSRKRLKYLIFLDDIKLVN